MAAASGTRRAARAASPRQALLSACAVSSVVSLCACSSIPPGRSAIDSVDVTGNRAIAGGDILDRLATTASPKFLSLFRGILVDYEVFDASALQRDLARVERYYRGRGFLEAHARTARVIHVSADHVQVEIVVDEGVPTTNRLIRIQGTQALTAAFSDDVWLAATKALPAGTRFDEDAFARARADITRTLTDRGYAFAKVTAHAQVDLAEHAIDYTFTVDPGEPKVFGKVSFQGLDPDGNGPRPALDEPPLRRALAIREGTPYSTAEIDTATQALLDLEVLASVQIVPDMSDSSAHEIPLTVKIEPAKLRVIKLGGGAEFDEIKTEVHGLVGWEDHDFLGGLRNFSVDFSPGVALYPLRVDNIQPVTNYFVGERLKFQFRQPGFLEARTNLFIQPAINTYPLLVTTTTPAPDAPVVGYFEPKGTVGLERRLGSHFFASIGHNVQGEIPFAYLNTLDPTLPTVFLSFPQLITRIDFKDNGVHPRAGFEITNDFQVAGGPFGGSATDLRLQPDVRGYVPIARGVVLALRGSLGFLLPSNYGYQESRKTVVNQSGQMETVYVLNPSNRDIQIVYFRGFFLGGPDSNRGYPLRGVAPHGPVPFLNPQIARQQVAANCNPNDPNFDPTSPTCSLPLGGMTMWAASAEFRIDLPGPLDAAVFCDVGDASPFVLGQSDAIRFNYLHMSCGAGARYDTPVGPIRLDIGYRIQPLQLLGQPDEVAAFNHDNSFGLPPTLFGTSSWHGIPAAIAFGIGESF
jgi:outer membrane protein insertion porin family/translocation and assembly module TamA